MKTIQRKYQKFRIGSFYLSIRGSLSLIFFFFLAACSENPRIPLRVGLIIDWPPHNLAPLALQLGYLDPQRVELVEFQSPAEATQAYLSGGLDAVALTLDYALEFHARDSQHQVFLIIDESLGGDAVISHKAYPRLSDLAGKRIGLEAGALGVHMLRSLLKKAGLAASDVELRFIDIPDQTEAFLNREVDAMITYEPHRTGMLRAGGHEIFSSREIPGEIFDVFIARRTLIEKRMADFKHFSESWFLALERLKADPGPVAQQIRLSEHFTTEEFLAAFNGLQMYSAGDNRLKLVTDPESFIKSISPLAKSVTADSLGESPQPLTRLTTGEVIPNSL